MGTHATILEKVLASEPGAKEAAGQASPGRTPQHRAWSELSTRLFSTEPRSAIAFGSIHRRAGVTHTIAGVAADLRRSGKTVALLNGSLHPVERIASSGSEPRVDSRIILGTTFNGATRGERVSIAHLRERYDAILLDCGSLDTSTDLLRIAPDADGVVLTVEAGHTSKEQIERAAALISEAHGKLLGCVLNKRRYPVPGWLYKML